MKLNRTYLFIAISSLALVIVLILQVTWIVRTAEIKEQLFNEKANMVLTRTAEAISKDKQACKNMESGVGQNETRKIDSLFKHYMLFYNFHIEYYFEVRPGSFPITKQMGISPNFTPTQPACYQKSLEQEANNNGLNLKLVIPDKEQFIMEEMGVLFISSVVLIVIVLILFWRTFLSLINDKKILEHTADFLNNMTHEFKTPLTNIALAGKMIVKDLKQEEKIKHYSGIILEENEKLRLQVEQVLSMTALERGEIPVQKTELDLHQLITYAVKCIGVQVESRQGNLKLNLTAERFVIMGDKTHLTNALCNLVDNALKYSKENPEISIQTSNKDQQIVVVITDNGVGIAEDYKEKVFEKFFRVPTGDVHDVKGFGLGLAYVKKIIELHGGTIKLESEIEVGTTFTITLPNV